MVLEKYFSEVEKSLDESGTVTYRWLANKLHIKAATSKRVLSEYLDQHPELHSSHVIIGERNGAHYSFSIAPVDKLEEEKKLFDKISNSHLYALHSAPTSNDQLQACSMDKEQASAMLLSNNKVESLVNDSGAVKYKDLNVLPAGEKLSSSAPEIVKPTPSSTGSKNKVTANRPVSKPTATPAAKKIAEQKEKVASKARSFFESGKSTSAQSKLTTPSAPSSNESSTQQNLGEGIRRNESGVKEDRKMEVVKKVEDDEEAEWDDGSGTTYVPNKENIKKRKVAPGAPEGSGGMHQSDAIVAGAEDSNSGYDSSGASSDDSDAEGAKKAKSKSKAKKSSDEGVESGTPGKKGRKRAAASCIPVHGAMDDILEDLNHKGNEDGTPAKKPKRKKLVEKMFADAKGYLVTEMVLEEVSDDEDTSSAPPSKPAPKPKKQEKAPPKKAPASKSTQGKQQRSMTSFFSKKYTR
eukprot:CAMPEP_0185022474 /NCGR_PEP_ID=MMETSP1103-20130426/5178_1 /TAXON_ID=36769 /ORGANISM="Paraphysomonas bandaiensis, Strain Caron Lab Isolate" /LENGTH=465 /DNA_ID=CAMNT_0027554551 /DNA_START=1 /DNA_END=1398 /DNA_ORIENTATION=-